MSVSYGGDSIVFADGSVNSSGFIGHRNRIINGAMVIDQRNAGASVTPANGAYTLDRWICFQTTSSKYSVQQQTSVVPTGFTYATKITSLSSYSVLSSDYYTFQQKFEGYNIADLGWGTANAKTVTLSFWVYSSLTGTFGGSFFNASGARSYPFTYTISSANTWEQKSVTIAGDTSGTWPTDNSASIILAFTLGVGSSNAGTAGAWASAFYTGPTGATSVVGTNGATWYITGVQLERGSTASSFEYRSYGAELALCQRYYQRNFNPAGGGYITNSNSFVGLCKCVVSMRTAPTITQISGSTITYDLFGVTTGTIATPSFGNATVNGFRIWGAGTLSATFGNPGHLESDCVQATAEL